MLTNPIHQIAAGKKDFVNVHILTGLLGIGYLLEVYIPIDFVL
jgi:hypothetical protein